MAPLALLFALLSLAAAEDFSAAPPRATLSTGVVEGRFLTTPNGNFVKIYQGIPYAQPPLNGLRFQFPFPMPFATGRIAGNVRPSIPPKPWEGVKATKDWPNSCLYTVLPRPRNHGGFSEDCLYANVYAGLNCTVENPCPVLIYTYGGAHQFGSSSEYDPALLSDFYASRGIVFIDFNYRVGSWGFWNTATDDAPGNYGLWDILRLLGWVQAEIGAMGGRPDSVSLWGLSSSSIDVSAVSLSPLSEGLLTRIILQSGSAVVPNGAKDNLAAGEQLAISANCTTHDEWMANDNFPAIVRCMQGVSSDVLYKAQKVLDSMGILYMAPRIDGTILPAQGPTLAKYRRPLTAMIGSTAKEGAMTVLPEMAGRNATLDDVLRHCRKGIKMEGAISNVAALEEQCVELYASRASTDGGLLPALIDIDSAVEFWAPSYSDAASLTAAGGTAFLYSFDYVKTGFERMFPAHAADMEYNLRKSFLPQDDRDALIRAVYPEYYANFAKFGNPTPWDKDWKPLSSPDAFNYYSIDLPRSLNRVGYHKDDWNFWAVQVPQLGSSPENGRANTLAFESGGRGSAQAQDEWEERLDPIGDDAKVDVPENMDEQIQQHAKPLLLKSIQNDMVVQEPSVTFSLESIIGIIAGVMVILVVVGSVIGVRRRRKNPERARLLGSWLYEENV